jgi:hypothetical protein
VILVCAAARPDVSISAKSAAASRTSLFFIGFLR